MKTTELKWVTDFLIDLAISGAIVFDNPTSFGAKGFEDFIVITVFRELEIALSSKAGVNLGGYGSSLPLSSLVVLPLLPRRQPPRWRTAIGSHLIPRPPGKQFQPPRHSLFLCVCVNCVYYRSYGRCLEREGLNWDIGVTRTMHPHALLPFVVYIILLTRLIINYYKYFI